MIPQPTRPPKRGKLTTPMATIDAFDFQWAPPPRTMAASDHPREHE